MPKADSGSVDHPPTPITTPLPVDPHRIAREQLEVLAEASLILGASLDYATTLHTLGQFLVPRLADVCVIDLVGARGEVKRVSITAERPDRQAAMEELARHFPPDPKSGASRQVVATGKSQLIPHIDEIAQARVSKSDFHRSLLNASGVHSVMLVPLIVRDRVIGVINLGMADSGRHYSADDLPLAEAIARRAALAVDNARLYRRARKESRRRKHIQDQAVMYGDVAKHASIGLTLWKLGDLNDPHSLRLIAANPAMEAILQQSMQSQIGKRIYEVFPEMEHDSRAEMYADVVRTGQSVELNQYPDAAFHNPDQRLYTLRAFPLPGQRVGVAMQDVTDLRRYQHQLSRALERETAGRQAAEQSVQDRMRFLAMVSHELRTPLSSIKGFASSLLADDVTWDETSQRSFLHVINDEADRLAELIEQVLDLSRLEAGTLSINLMPVAIHRVISSIMPQLMTLCEHHRLNVRLDPNIPDVTADSRRIEQVLTNLVNNACKYSPPGSLVEIAARVDGTMVRVSVSDQGVGIPEEERANVFETFHQASNRPSTETRGVGLGLTIARALIEAHSGTIWIDDHDGPGTTISFTLPLA